MADSQPTGPSSAPDDDNGVDISPQVDRPLVPTHPAVIDDLLAQLTAGTATLQEPDPAMAHLVCDPDTANRILTAADQPDTRLWWTGTVTANWELPELQASLIISGPVNGDLNISGPVGGLSIPGSIKGDLTIFGPVGENLDITGSVKGDLTIFGPVDGDLNIGSGTRDRVLRPGRPISVGGSLTIWPKGSVKGDLIIWESGSVGGHLTITDPLIARKVTVADPPVKGDLTIFGSVGRYLLISGSVGGNLTIRESGSIGGYLDIAGSVDGHLTIWGSVGRYLLISGSVNEYLNVSGKVKGQFRIGSSGVVADRLALSGRVGEIVFFGSINHECILTPGPGDPVPLRSVVGARFGDEVFIGDRIRIDDCDFRQCADLDKLRLVGADLFPSTPITEQRLDAETERRAINYRRIRASLEGREDSDTETDGQPDPEEQPETEEQPDAETEQGRKWWRRRSTSALSSAPTDAHSQELGPVPDAELAIIYRQLRASLEGRKDRPNAGRFYVGETDARRRDARADRRWVEWFVLAAYRAMSGYGLRTGRAVGWFVLVAIVGTGLFLVNGLDLDPTADAVDRASVVEAFTFTVRSMVAFISPPTAELTVTEEWIQLGLRFSGPVLLAQAILAVRERVAR